MTSTASILCLVLLIGCISAARRPRLVGGSDTDIRDFPFLVSIRYTDTHFCGGSIISDRHILTAGHCMVGVEGEFMNETTVHSGTTRSDKVGNVHQLESVHIHPKFNISVKVGRLDDIAILTLKDPIVFDQYQQKINLPSHNVQDQQTAYVVGWGANVTHSDPVKQLQKLQVVISPYDKCEPVLKYEMHPEQVCAFGSSTSGTCGGDSGGPLVSNGEIVGIVASGDIGKCADDAPDVYTNVFAYKDYIESIMSK